jgi:O-antigen ligase
MAGAGAATLFISAHWTLALVGAAAVLALSGMESEPFILLIIFLIPLGWTLQADLPVRNVPVALRSLVAIGFFGARLLRGRGHIGQLFHPTVSRASLLFFSVAAASSFLAQGGLTHESGRALYELATYVSFYFVVLAWANSRQRVGRVLWVMLISTVVTAAFAVYQEIIGGYTSLWLLVAPRDEYFAGWDGRSPSFLGHANTLAGYLNLVLPFALACSVRGQDNWKKLGGWTVGLGFLGLLCSQSLGGLAAFLSILVLAIFCFARTRTRRVVLLVGLCTLVAALYLLTNNLNPAHTGQAIASDTVTRLLLWQTAWNYFVDSPVIGVGWGNFVGLYAIDLTSFSNWFQPGVSEVHNVYLQLLAETGLVGFAAFFYLIVQSWRRAWCQLHSSIDPLASALAFGILGALLSILVHGLVDVPFRPQTGTLLWVLIALLVVNDRLHRASLLGSVRTSQASPGKEPRVGTVL